MALSADNICGMTGYDGALSLELTNPQYYLDPMPAMRRSVEVLSDAIGRMA